MKKNKKTQIGLWIILLTLSFIGCTSWYFLSNNSSKNFQSRFSKQIAYIYNNIEQQGEKISFVKDSIVYYSANSIPISNEEEIKNRKILNNSIIVELKNGIYLHKSKIENDTTTHYLYLIKNKFPIENIYLNNTFNHPFDLDKNIEIVSYPTDFPIILNNEKIGYLEASPECLHIKENDLFVFKLWLALNLFFLCIFFIYSGIFDFTTKYLVNINNLARQHRNLKRKKYKKEIKQIIGVFVLYTLYIIFAILLCYQNPNISFKLITNKLDYNNILVFVYLTLSGFIVYLLTTQTLRIKPKQKYYLAKQFSILLIIATIAGGILQFYCIKNTQLKIENKAKKLISENNNKDLHNFQILLNAAVKDSISKKYISQKDFSNCENYIKKYYLSLLKDDYHTDILVFDSDDSITIQPYNKLVNILSYVKNRINTADTFLVNKDENNNKKIEFFVNNNNTNIASYMYFHRQEDIYFFAECLKKEHSKNMNYSLLLENNKEDDEVSYAIYQDSILIYSLGERNFAHKLKTLSNGWKRQKNYNTYYVNKANKTYIIYSEAFSAYKILGAISMFFLLLCFMLGVENLINNIPHLGKTTLSIKSKILISLIGSFIFVLIILGFFSIRSTINLNKYNNVNTLKEKTVSIRLEIEKILDNRGDITENDLINLSNTFLTDINIFDNSGNLILSSQNDFFNKGIISKKIDNNAFKALKEENNNLFYHKETIGKSNFFASYCPITTNFSEENIYLNIPFINGQKIMNNNINDLINNFANMFLFWINIAVVIFVFLSNIITKPLEILKEKMGKVNINAHNDKIVWEKNDEMGQLIKSYNMMIDKIEESSVLLKQQERLASWRELAKQVAHDIKNPLTPMKLSIQYLQKLYYEKPNVFDVKWKEISPSLISQIESLSTITQELNSYGKPNNKKEKVNLDECIINAINLFANTDNITFAYTPVKDCFVLGDTKLFIRIFNNLLKNSIQSLYNTKNGKIDIAISKNNNKYIVSIKDNGSGIKDEDKNKIFNTQFTTKQDGGGIGLTIVKNILESYNATIDFKSKENLGTVFFIGFNIFNKQEQILSKEKKDIIEN